MHEPSHKEKQDTLINTLVTLLSKDIDPHSGKLWSYVYETGDPSLREAAEKAYVKALWRNMLDPTVFPSVITLEKEVVEFVLTRFNAPEGSIGNFTSGGTETNFLAVLAAREKFYESRGRVKTPKIVAPATVHPSVAKAAWQLGLELELSRVNTDDYTADIDDLLEKIDDRTAMVVLSAPNYPFGTFDPVKEVAEALENKNIWLHVDSCLGFAVPFARENGKDIPVTDFRIPRVDSIGVDLHKLGYAPRGSSVIMHRDKNNRKYHLYVYSKWPGYPLVNQVALSSRTAGPLAASWILLNTLGVDGYRELTRLAYEARDKLIEIMESNGFKLVGNPPYLVLAFTNPEKDLVDFAAKAGEAGWHIQVQPGSRHLGFPMTVHFTVTPVHIKVVDKFAADLPGIITGTMERKSMSDDPLYQVLSTAKPEELANIIPMIVEALGAGEGLEGADISFIARYIHELDPELVDIIFREVANLLL